MTEAFAGSGRGNAPPESEDCLFLNLWTPALKDGKKRPVMFWLHGGGAGGSASTPLYFGQNLAKRGDVVVVTINHRLNIFGFTTWQILAVRTMPIPEMWACWMRWRPWMGDR